MVLVSRQVNVRTVVRSSFGNEVKNVYTYIHKQVEVYYYRLNKKANLLMITYVDGM